MDSGHSKLIDLIEDGTRITEIRSPCAIIALNLFSLANQENIHRWSRFLAHGIAGVCLRMKGIKINKVLGLS